MPVAGRPLTTDRNLFEGKAGECHVLLGKLAPSRVIRMNAVPVVMGD